MIKWKASAVDSSISGKYFKSVLVNSSILFPHVGVIPQVIFMHTAIAPFITVMAKLCLVQPTNTIGKQLKNRKFQVAAI